MFAPTIQINLEFCKLAFAVATGLALIIEYVRVCRIPPFGLYLHSYMRNYTDSRDQGVAILTHLYLLTGCAIPLMTSHPLAGVLVLGAGDAAGAIVGSTIGRMRWPNVNKTVEGTLSGILSILLAQFVLVGEVPAAFVYATVITCLVEAWTSQIDNLILPLVFIASIEGVEKLYL